jgi:hypothetical protein
MTSLWRSDPAIMVLCLLTTIFETDQSGIAEAEYRTLVGAIETADVETTLALMGKCRGA